MSQAQATPLLMTCLHVNFLQDLQTLTDVFCYSARLVLFLFATQPLLIWPLPEVYKL